MWDSQCTGAVARGSPPVRRCQHGLQLSREEGREGIPSSSIHHPALPPARFEMVPWYRWEEEEGKKKKREREGGNHSAIQGQRAPLESLKRRRNFQYKPTDRWSGGQREKRKEKGTGEGWVGNIASRPAPSRGRCPFPLVARAKRRRDHATWPASRRKKKKKKESKRRLHPRLHPTCSKPPSTICASHAAAVPADKAKKKKKKEGVVVNGPSSSS